MKDERDILQEAIKRLKAEPAEPGPPQALVDATLEKLATPGSGQHRSKATYIKLIAKVTVAAATLVLIGYAIGRATAPPAPDVDQIKAELADSLTASIELIVRRKVVMEMRGQWQVAMANGFAQIKEDLGQQYRSDLDRFAVQLLATSNARTNQILGQLVQNIKTAETQKMQWVVEALQEIDRAHRLEQSQLATNLETLAYQTKDGLQQTRKELVQLLANTYPSMEPSTIQEDEETRDL